MNKIKTIVIALILSNLLHFKASSQSFTKVNLDKKFGYHFELSSLDSKGGTLYTASEKCGYAFSIEAESLTKSETKSKKYPIQDWNDNDYQIEGMAIYGKYLFYTDETKMHIRLINRQNWSEINLKMDSKYSPQSCRKDIQVHCGLEGLEVNQEQNILYALREKNELGNSELYSFNINMNGGKPILTLLKKTTFLQHDGYRYCGLALNADNKDLYLLRTKKGSYHIDKLVLGSDWLPGKNTYRSKALKTRNISTDINSYNPKNDPKKTSTNIEGITIWKDKIILVSDNCLCSKKDAETKCSEININTLMLITDIGVFK